MKYKLVPIKDLPNILTLKVRVRVSPTREMNDRIKSNCEERQIISSNSNNRDKISTMINKSIEKSKKTSAAKVRT